jgi:hypothetical protein
MTHKEKIAHLEVELKANGLNPEAATPGWYTVLRAMEILKGPPHFQPMLVNILCPMIVLLMSFLVFFILVTLVSAFMFGFIAWRGLGYLILIALVAFFKFCVQAGKYRSEARKLKLPAWKYYPKVGGPGRGGQVRRANAGTSQNGGGVAAHAEERVQARLDWRGHGRRPPRQSRPAEGDGGETRK